MYARGYYHLSVSTWPPTRKSSIANCRPRKKRKWQREREMQIRSPCTFRQKLRHVWLTFQRVYVCTCTLCTNFTFFCCLSLYIIKVNEILLRLNHSRARHADGENVSIAFPFFSNGLLILAYVSFGILETRYHIHTHTHIYSHTHPNYIRPILYTMF